MDDQSTHQLEPQAESADSKRVGIAGWFFWFFMSLLLYVLSVGPAAKLVDAKIIPIRVFATIYAPLESLDRSWPPAKSFFAWYFTLWGLK